MQLVTEEESDRLKAEAMRLDEEAWRLKWISDDTQNEQDKAETENAHNAAAAAYRKFIKSIR